MSNPEEGERQDSLRDSVIATVQGRLEGVEYLEYRPIEIEGEDLLSRVARAIYGHRFERSAKFPIGTGYAWTDITEYTTVRFGRSKVSRLIVRGRRMTDSEGRSVEGLWYFDLLSKQPYRIEEYELLKELFESDVGEVRDELFYRIAGLQT